MRHLLVVGLIFLAGALASAQDKVTDHFSTSNCMGCHGQSAMGGLGPPIAKTTITLDEFIKTVRGGKGMMPATSEADLPDDQLKALYQEVEAKPWLPNQIPIAFKVAQLLTTRNVSRIFLGVFLFAAIFAVRGLLYWLRCAGLKQLMPRVVKFGLFKSAGVVIKSFFIDGLLVGSLWKANRTRWLMHGLILYGFLGLMLSDILLSIFNPTRGDLPMLNPLKLLPVICGVSVFCGVLFVMVRYKKDSYIDNGLTLGKDFLFVNLLLHTIISGFLTVTINRFAISDWVMTVYIYHLISITLLIATAPFTRFQHAWVVPVMVSMTRLTEAIVASNVDIGYSREPSPGRHHKSEKIAASVMKSLGEEYSDDFRLRYYP